MSIRFRLMIGFITVILVVNSALSLLTVAHINRVFLQEVQTRVMLDLNSAHRVYHSHTETIAQFLEAVALEPAFVDAVQRGDVVAIGQRLESVQSVIGVDMLDLVDSQGRTIHRAQNPGVSGDDVSENQIVSLAMGRGEIVSGTAIVSQAILQREGEHLAERAQISILSTPAARENGQGDLHDGMVLGAATPLHDESGACIGVLYGADLLSRNFDLIDQITEDVFFNQSADGIPAGTATIFQGSVRIATNVPSESGVPAVGTRLSDEVQQRVLDEGRMWNRRAFVVNSWYITAYEPIRDPDGAVIGALYVGLPEAPYRQPLMRAVFVFLILVIAASLACLALLYFVTRHILWPVNRSVDMAQRVVDGDLSARTGIRPPGEMGQLCTAIDAMADAVEQREEQLRLSTQRQIGQSEKLASIGRLAAGIAHEINNPLTGVLTFSHMLRERPNMEDRDLHDLEVIVRETTRVREIVRGLLDFARESPSMQESLDSNEVIRSTLRLVRSQKEFRNIAITEDLVGTLPPIIGDRNQLQQVLLNLALNACEAMSQGGTLTVKTTLRGREVEITIGDTGSGIAPEDIGKIYDPFFTTKPVGKGTGLGLSVSYGIIQQHGGTIQVDSEQGRGTVFTIRLPVHRGEAAQEGLA